MFDGFSIEELRVWRTTGRIEKVQGKEPSLQDVLEALDGIKARKRQPPFVMKASWDLVRAMRKLAQEPSI